MSRNGYLTDDELTPVQGGIQLPNAAAAAWLALEAAVKEERGVDLQITSPAGGYRPIEMQRAMVLNPAAFGARAVAAAGHSVHGQLPGCVDIYNWAAVGSTALDAIAARFGFRRTIKSEPWHYQHDGSAQGGGLAAATPATPDLTPDEEEEDDMTALKYDHVLVKGSGAPVWLVRLDDEKPLNYRQVKPGEYQAYITVGVPLLTLSDEDANGVLAGANPWAR